MSWRENILDASFNGIRFGVQEHRSNHGHRLAVHEFPGRDRPEVEHLGRKARELALTAILVGPDYMQARDQLVNELEKKAIGTLVHPWLGSIRVAVREFELEESWSAGGKALVSITFIDADAISAGAVVPVTTDQVLASAAALKNTSRQALARLPVPTSPASIVEQINQLSAFTTQLSNQVRQLQSWTDSILVAPLAAVLRAAQSLRDDLGRLVALPGVLADTLTALASGVFALFADDADAGFRVALQWGDASAGTDPLSQWQAATGIAVAAELLPQRTFDSSAAAVAARDQLLQRIAQLEVQGDDALYLALIDVRTAVTAEIGALQIRLPQLTQYQPPSTVPAVVIAFQLYGDARRAGEVVARNRVSHPGFVAGGRRLEVLTDG